MSSGFSLDAQIDEVEALVEFEQSSYQASKGERSLDAIGAFRPPSTKCSDDNVYAHRTCRKQDIDHLRQ